METSEPIFNAPRAVVAVIAVFALVHAGLWALPAETAEWFLFVFAFIPARFSAVPLEWPGGSAAAITSWLTHMFVHADLAHLILNSASLLAFGGAVAKRTGGLRFLAFSLLCGLAGAGVFLASNIGLQAPMIGASGAISGLMAAAMLLLCSALDQGRFPQLRDAPQSVVRMPLDVALRDRRILAATAAFLVLNLLAMYGLGGVDTANGIAWEAHLGGYFAGLFLFGLFDVAARNDEEHQPIPH